MTVTIEQLDCLASILGYPESDIHDTVRTAQTLFASTCNEMVEGLASFGNVIADQPYQDIEELYTRTFDMDPACALEIGWHVFGESYDRGMMLVWMRGQLREYGIEEKRELPDHLTHALRVLARMDEEQQGEFSRLCLLLAVRKVRSGLKSKDCPYTPVINGLDAFLVKNFGDIEESGDISLDVIKQHEELFSLESV